MKWLVEKKTSAGFALALLIAMIIGPVSYRSMNRLEQSTERINHTHQVLAKLDGVVSALQDVENRARDFVLGGDEHFLQRYDLAIVQVRRKLEELRTLTADDLHQQRKLDLLGPLMERRIASAAEVVAMRKSRRLGPAAAKVATGDAEELMNQSRAVIAALRAEENRRLGESEAKVKETALSAVLLLSGLTCLIIALLGLLFYFITRDRAERKRAEEALRESDLRFRIVARATNEAVWDWNLANDAVWWNRSVQTLFGYTDDQVGLDHAWWMQNLHPADRDRVVSSITAQVRSDKDFWSAEYRFRRADGTYADIFDRGYVLRHDDGKAVRMIGAMQDITERKREEEMARARDAALESVRLKSLFLANMSHEIRTPMNSVIGMTGLLLDTELTDEQRQYAETVRLSGEALLTVINDILDFSKIEAGKLVFETVDFEPQTTVEEVIDLLAEQAHAKKLRLGSSLAEDVPARLRGDPGRLRQVLTNLVGNAIKFTHQGQVTVRILKESETVTHAVLRFEVADTGIGIPDKTREQLFQPFSQGDPSSSRRYGGAGLGLAICKQLVQLMAGQIGLDSMPGQGSTFWFTARFEKAAAPGTTAEADSGESSRSSPARDEHTRALGAERRENARLLVAEDNIFNQKVVLRQLEQLGYSVDVVANGVEVLAAMDRIPYDLILMDCQMPEMDGYEATLEIRRRQCDSKHTPVIAMTAHVMKEDRDRCLAAGMDDFLSKPVRVANLDSLVTHWLNQPLRGKGLRSQPPPTNDRSQPKDPTGPAEARDATPAVDMEIFLEVAGGEEKLRDLADRYLQRTHEHFAELRTAVRAGAAADIKRIAHSTAGSSAMCGMVRLVAMLRQLERMGHERRLDGMADVFARAEKELECVEQFLQTHVSGATNAASDLVADLKIALPTASLACSPAPTTGERT